MSSNPIPQISAPRRGRPHRGAPTLLALALLVGSAGCGKQGAPTPPLRAVPAPTRDLTAVQQGAQILLSFTYPKTTPAGAPLAGITAVEILEMARPAAPDGTVPPVDPRQFNAAAKPRMTAQGADLTAATSGDRIVIALPISATVPTTPTTETTASATPEARYFAVRTTGKNGDRSEISNVAAVAPKAPPRPPEQVTVTARADGVQIEWTGVEGAAAGYNIYRRASTERTHGPAPIHQAQPAERSWLDSTAVFGNDYIYTVTSIAQRDPVVESGIGSEHEVRYQDRFPPSVPSDLVALAEAGRVRLVWEPAEAGDLAGYLVYRRSGTGEFTRITERPVESPEHVDTSVAAGQAYSYRVTAVDQAGNESGASAEVRTEVP